MGSKINYLTKDELLYELSFRGIEVNSNTCVELLRKILRQNIHVVGDVKHLNGKLNLEEEISALQIKVSSLSVLLENPDIISPLYVSKVNCKINHLSSRIKNLGYVKDLNQEQSSVITNLDDDIKNLSVKFQELKEKVPNQDVETFETKLNISMVEEEDIMDNLINITSSSPLKLNSDILTTKNVPVSNTVSTQCSVPFSSQNIEPTQLKISTNTLLPNSSMLFNKLPNPLEKYLNQFCVTDGLDINKLLQFLRALVKIGQETSLSQMELYQILPSHCLGPLLNKIIEARNKNLSLEELQLDILTTFVPVTLREKLKHDLVFRPQFHGEPLPVYISEVKINAEILKTFLTETDIVTFIRNGIHPEIRNKLVFEKNPTTFRDLDNLCISSNNVTYNDFIRDSHFNDIPKSNASINRPTQSRPMSVCQSYQPRNTRPSFTVTGKDKVCFNCQKPGHLAKNCFNLPKNL